MTDEIRRTIFKSENPYCHVFFDRLDLTVYIDTKDHEWEFPAEFMKAYIKDFLEAD